MKKQPKRNQMNWRPLPDDLRILEKIKGKLGVSDTDVIRLGIRLLFEREIPANQGEDQA